MSHEVPGLETRRMLLRPITLEFCSDYTKFFVDYEVIKNLSYTVPWPYPKGGVENYIRSVILPSQGKTRWAWGLFLKVNSHELIGGIDLWRDGCPENRGFWLGRPFWGMGLMTEAASVVNSFAFSQLGFQKLIFSNAKGNLKSRRIKEKTGARFVGLRPAKFVDPSLTEAETWELTLEEWLNLQSGVSTHRDPEKEPGT